MQEAPLRWKAVYAIVSPKQAGSMEAFYNPAESSPTLWKWAFPSQCLQVTRRVQVAKHCKLEEQITKTTLPWECSQEQLVMYRTSMWTAEHTPCPTVG